VSSASARVVACKRRVRSGATALDQGQRLRFSPAGGSASLAEANGGHLSQPVFSSLAPFLSGVRLSHGAWPKQCRAVDTKPMLSHSIL
jgi:hypothetical protein